MGEKRKLYEQVRKDLAAIERVKQLVSSVDSLILDKEEELGSFLDSIGPGVCEARREFEKSKRRFHMASELFNDSFFTLRSRDNLADIRDMALAEWKTREKIWNEL